jgi:hypothetical protein
VETQAYRDGESQGAESKKEICGSGDKDELADWDCRNPASAAEEKGVNSSKTNESDGKTGTGVVCESEAETQSHAGTSGAARCGNESALGGEKSREREWSPERFDGSRPGTVTRRLEVKAAL